MWVPWPVVLPDAGSINAAVHRHLLNAYAEAVYERLSAQADGQSSATAVLTTGVPSAPSAPYMLAWESEATARDPGRT